MRDFDPICRRSLLVLILVTTALFVPSPAAAADACAPVVNPIACENTKAGTPKATWDVSGSGSAAQQENAAFRLILPTDVWYMMGTMSQPRPAFGFYFSWYFTR